MTLTEQGTFIVSGDHTYDSGGTFPITVLVTDEEGATFAGQNDAVVTLDADRQQLRRLRQRRHRQHRPGHDRRPGRRRPARSPPPSSTGATAPTTAATIRYDDTDDEYDVLGDHVYDQPGTYDVIIEITEDGTPTDIGAVATIDPGWSLSGGQLTNSPTAAEIVDLGQAQVALNTGGLGIDQPLDFDQSGGTAVGGDATLVYNSDTVDVRPIIQAQLASSDGRPRPRRASRSS